MGGVGIFGQALESKRHDIAEKELRPETLDAQLEFEDKKSTLNSYVGAAQIDQRLF